MDSDAPTMLLARICALRTAVLLGVAFLACDPERLRTEGTSALRPFVVLSSSTAPYTALRGPASFAPRRSLNLDPRPLSFSVSSPTCASPGGAPLPPTRNGSQPPRPKGPATAVVPQRPLPSRPPFRDRKSALWLVPVPYCPSLCPLDYRAAAMERLASRSGDPVRRAGLPRPTQSLGAPSRAPTPSAIPETGALLGDPPLPPTLAPVAVHLTDRAADGSHVLTGARRRISSAGLRPTRKDTNAPLAGHPSSTALNVLVEVRLAVGRPSDVLRSSSTPSTCGTILDYRCPSPASLEPSARLGPFESGPDPSSPSPSPSPPALPPDIKP
ncbi:uncharacterized protein PSFLO_02228 [Pseudozyma flocculosa]|uniref:Uncharacterized protein n=1 Tax=Pseudozyma flocculosa TaxID=84751 RepID=A0A5C3EZB1_9BASI|nr:uncharacterized protein PSFLO_02228 [Pseudozyma flocculosa]